MEFASTASVAIAAAAVIEKTDDSDLGDSISEAELILQCTQRAFKSIPVIFVITKKKGPDFKVSFKNLRRSR